MSSSPSLCPSPGPSQCRNCLIQTQDSYSVSSESVLSAASTSCLYTVSRKSYALATFSSKQRAVFAPGSPPKRRLGCSACCLFGRMASSAPSLQPKRERRRGSQKMSKQEIIDAVIKRLYPGSGPGFPRKVPPQRFAKPAQKCDFHSQAQSTPSPPHHHLCGPQHHHHGPCTHPLHKATPLDDTSFRKSWKPAHSCAACTRERLRWSRKVCYYNHRRRFFRPSSRRMNSGLERRKSYEDDLDFIPTKERSGSSKFSPQTFSTPSRFGSTQSLQGQANDFSYSFSTLSRSSPLSLSESALEFKEEVGDSFCDWMSDIQGHQVSCESPNPRIVGETMVIEPDESASQFREKPPISTMILSETELKSPKKSPEHVLRVERAIAFSTTENVMQSPTETTLASSVITLPALSVIDCCAKTQIPFVVKPDSDRRVAKLSRKIDVEEKVNNRCADISQSKSSAVAAVAGQSMEFLLTAQATKKETSTSPSPHQSPMNRVHGFDTSAFFSNVDELNESSVVFETVPVFEDDIGFTDASLKPQKPSFRSFGCGTDLYTIPEVSSDLSEEERLSRSLVSSGAGTATRELSAPSSLFDSLEQSPTDHARHSRASAPPEDEDLDEEQQNASGGSRQRPLSFQHIGQCHLSQHEEAPGIHSPTIPQHLLPPVTLQPCMIDGSIPSTAAADSSSARSPTATYAQQGPSEYLTKIENVVRNHIQPGGRECISAHEKRKTKSSDRTQPFSSHSVPDFRDEECQVGHPYVKDEDEEHTKGTTETPQSIVEELGRTSEVESGSDDDESVESVEIEDGDNVEQFDIGLDYMGLISNEENHTQTILLGRRSVCSNVDPESESEGSPSVPTVICSQHQQRDVWATDAEDVTKTPGNTPNSTEEEAVNYPDTFTEESQSSSDGSEIIGSSSASVQQEQPSNPCTTKEQFRVSRRSSNEPVIVISSETESSATAESLKRFADSVVYDILNETKNVVGEILVDFQEIETGDDSRAEKSLVLSTDSEKEETTEQQLLVEVPVVELLWTTSTGDTTPQKPGDEKEFAVSVSYSKVTEASKETSLASSESSDSNEDLHVEPPPSFAVNDSSESSSELESMKSHSADEDLKKRKALFEERYRRDLGFSEKVAEDVLGNSLSGSQLSRLLPQEQETTSVRTERLQSEGQEVESESIETRFDDSIVSGSMEGTKSGTDRKVSENSPSAEDSSTRSGIDVSLKEVGDRDGRQRNFGGFDQAPAVAHLTENPLAEFEERREELLEASPNYIDESEDAKLHDESLALSISSSQSDEEPCSLKLLSGLNSSPPPPEAIPVGESRRRSVIEIFFESYEDEYQMDLEVSPERSQTEPPTEEALSESSSLEDDTQWSTSEMNKKSKSSETNAGTNSATPFQVTSSLPDRKEVALPKSEHRPLADDVESDSTGEHELEQHEEVIPEDKRNERLLRLKLPEYSKSLEQMSSAMSEEESCLLFDPISLSQGKSTDSKETTVTSSFSEGSILQANEKSSTLTEPVLYASTQGSIFLEETSSEIASTGDSDQSVWVRRDSALPNGQTDVQTGIPTDPEDKLAGMSEERRKRLSWEEPDTRNVETGIDQDQDIITSGTRDTSSLFETTKEKMEECWESLPLQPRTVFPQISLDSVPLQRSNVKPQRSLDSHMWLQEDSRKTASSISAFFDPDVDVKNTETKKDDKRASGEYQFALMSKESGPSGEHFSNNEINVENEAFALSEGISMDLLPDNYINEPIKTQDGTFVEFEEKWREFASLKSAQEGSSDIAGEDKIDQSPQRPFPVEVSVSTESAIDGETRGSSVLDTEVNPTYESSKCVTEIQLSSGQNSYETDYSSWPNGWTPRSDDGISLDMNGHLCLEEASVHSAEVTFEDEGETVGKLTSIDSVIQPRRTSPTSSAEEDERSSGIGDIMQQPSGMANTDLTTGTGTSRASFPSTMVEESGSPYSEVEGSIDRSVTIFRYREEPHSLESASTVENYNDDSSLNSSFDKDLDIQSPDDFVATTCERDQEPERDHEAYIELYMSDNEEQSDEVAVTLELADEEAVIPENEVFRRPTDSAKRTFDKSEAESPWEFDLPGTVSHEEAVLEEGVLDLRSHSDEEQVMSDDVLRDETDVHFKLELDSESFQEQTRTEHRTDFQPIHQLESPRTMAHEQSKIIDDADEGEEIMLMFDFDFAPSIPSREQSETESYGSEAEPVPDSQTAVESLTDQKASITGEWQNMDRKSMYDVVNQKPSVPRIFVTEDTSSEQSETEYQLELRSLFLGNETAEDQYDKKTDENKEAENCEKNKEQVEESEENGGAEDDEGRDGDNERVEDEENRGVEDIQGRDEENEDDELDEENGGVEDEKGHDEENWRVEDEEGRDEETRGVRNEEQVEESEESGGAEDDEGRDEENGRVEDDEERYEENRGVEDDEGCDEENEDDELKEENAGVEDEKGHDEENGGVEDEEVRDEENRGVRNEEHVEESEESGGAEDDEGRDEENGRVEDDEERYEENRGVEDEENEDDEQEEENGGVEDEREHEENRGVEDEKVRHEENRGVRNEEQVEESEGSGRAEDDEGRDEENGRVEDDEEPYEENRGVEDEENEDDELEEENGGVEDEKGHEENRGVEDEENEDDELEEENGGVEDERGHEENRGVEDDEVRDEENGRVEDDEGCDEGNRGVEDEERDEENGGVEDDEGRYEQSKGIDDDDDEESKFEDGSVSVPDGVESDDDKEPGRAVGPKQEAGPSVLKDDGRGSDEEDIKVVSPDVELLALEYTAFFRELEEIQRRTSGELIGKKEIEYIPVRTKSLDGRCKKPPVLTENENIVPEIPRRASVPGNVAATSKEMQNVEITWDKIETTDEDPIPKSPIQIKVSDGTSLTPVEGDVEEHRPRDALVETGGQPKVEEVGSSSTPRMDQVEVEIFQTLPSTAENMEEVDKLVHSNNFQTIRVDIQKKIVSVGGDHAEKGECQETSAAAVKKWFGLDDPPIQIAKDAGAEKGVRRKPGNGNLPAAEESIENALQDNVSDLRDTAAEESSILENTEIVMPFVSNADETVVPVTVSETSCREDSRRSSLSTEDETDAKCETRNSMTTRRQPATNEIDVNSPRWTSWKTEDVHDLGECLSPRWTALNKPRNSTSVEEISEDESCTECFAEVEGQWIDSDNLAEQVGSPTEDHRMDGNGGSKDSVIDASDSAQAASSCSEKQPQSYHVLTFPEQIYFPSAHPSGVAEISAEHESYVTCDSGREILRRESESGTILKTRRDAWMEKEQEKQNRNVGRRSFSFDGSPFVGTFTSSAEEVDSERGLSAFRVLSATEHGIGTEVEEESTEDRLKIPVFLDVEPGDTEIGFLEAPDEFSRPYESDSARSEKLTSSSSSGNSNFSRESVEHLLPTATTIYDRMHGSTQTVNRVDDFPDEFKKIVLTENTEKDSKRKDEACSLTQSQARRFSLSLDTTGFLDFDRYPHPPPVSEDTHFPTPSVSSRLTKQEQKSKLASSDDSITFVFLGPERSHFDGVTSEVKAWTSSDPRSSDPIFSSSISIDRFTDSITEEESPRQRSASVGTLQQEYRTFQDLVKISEGVDRPEISSTSRIHHVRSAGSEEPGDPNARLLSAMERGTVSRVFQTPLSCDSTVFPSFSGFKYNRKASKEKKSVSWGNLSVYPPQPSGPRHAPPIVHKSTSQLGRQEGAATGTRFRKIHETSPEFASVPQIFRGMTADDRQKRIQKLKEWHLLRMKKQLLRQRLHESSSVSQTPPEFPADILEHTRSLPASPMRNHNVQFHSVSSMSQSSDNLSSTTHGGEPHYLHCGFHCVYLCRWCVEQVQGPSNQRPSIKPDPSKTSPKEYLRHLLSLRRKIVEVTRLSRLSESPPSYNSDS